MGSQIAFYNKSDVECCADTGATENMLDDYAAFTSYRKATNRYATLGDNTRLKIEGVGTAVYSLNGKVIKSRNCLHIPDLRGPLYSLRSHRLQPGCGIFHPLRQALSYFSPPSRYKLMTHVTILSAMRLLAHPTPVPSTTSNLTHLLCRQQHGTPAGHYPRHLPRPPTCPTSYRRMTTQSSQLIHPP